MRFLKMNGCGNDFAVLDARDRDTGIRLTPEAAKAIADRRNGAGCDQVVTLERPSGPWADMRVRFWNSDGSASAACGNGARCAAWLRLEEAGRDQVVLETDAGLLTAWRAGSMRVTVDMGPPRLDWTEIPLAEKMDTRRIELEVGPLGAPILHSPGAVSMGNPHVVFFVPDIATAPVESVGPMIEHHPLFPQGVNVGFAQVLAADRIRLRVWERGAGLTRACGTGACAALVAAARRGLTGRSAILELDGGNLEIEWASDGRVYMTGPVAVERAGEIAIG